MQLLKRHYCWLSLLVMLLLLISPATALANTNDAPETEQSTEQTAPPQPLFDDLALTRIYLRNHAFFPLDEALIDSATSVEQLMRRAQQVDPYARYYSAEIFQAVLTRGESDVVGIGVFLATDENDQVFILGPIAGSAAERAGLRYGDIIVSVDGVDTRNMTASELINQLHGDDGDLLVIRYERDGIVRENTLSRNLRTELSIGYWLLEGQEGIAYLQIDSFTSYTAQQVEDALESLANQGMTALILDLRYCPGGFFDSAIDISAQFTGPGPVAFFVSRRGWENFSGLNQVDTFDMPLAVLLNNYTASAAELVAANIQDVNAAPLIGETSFGKATIQSMITLPSGAGIVFTTSKFLSRGYQDIAAHGGLLPDVYVRGYEEQLAAALASIEEQRRIPSQVTFPVGRTVDAILFGGASFLAAESVLAQLGWDLDERDGIIYGQRQGRRLIINIAEAELLTGGAPITLIERDGLLYMPAAVLRDLGHTVDWDAATRSVIVSR